MPRDSPRVSLWGSPIVGKGWNPNDPEKMLAIHELVMYSSILVCLPKLNWRLENTLFLQYSRATVFAVLSYKEEHVRGGGKRGGGCEGEEGEEEGGQ